MCNAGALPMLAPKRTMGRFAGFTLQRVERGHRRGRDPFQPRWTGAAAKSRIIHSPNFYGAVVPHLGFSGDPAIGTVRVTIKSQHVDFSAAKLLSATRARGPQFHFTILEWDGFSNRAVRINRLRRRKQNQLIRQTKEHRHKNAACREHACRHDDLSHAVFCRSGYLENLKFIGDTAQ